jgi:hypothetical protein
MVWRAVPNFNGETDIPSPDRNHKVNITLIIIGLQNCPMQDDPEIDFVSNAA